MLTVYRRHRTSCPHRGQGRKYRRCHCPIWVDGLLGGEEIRKALRDKSRDPGGRESVRDWQKAQDIVRAWEAENAIDQGTDSEPVTIKEATDSFVADAGARNLQDGTLRKYRLLFRQLQEFADAQGFRCLKELDTGALRRFRVSWHDRNLSALKKLERLRSFFRFACENGWVSANPAKKLQRPQVSQRPTMPFSQDDMVKILAACNEWGEKHQGETRARENSWRIRALVLLLRYSGLRIQDAVTLARDRIADGRLFLYTAKTGTPVYLPLPGFVVEALDRAPTSKRYFFWTGDSKPESVTKNWQNSLRELFRTACVAKGHAHRFRDTVAVDMLMAGVPIERVSVLLGHSSVRVTEKYYAPWVRARQAQLEEDVRRVWQKDPLWIAETKGTPEVHGKRELVN